MRRFAVGILVLAFAALGSGWLLHVHNAAHAAEHAESAADAGEGHHHLPPNSQSCELHARLASPVLSVDIVPILTALGLAAVFLTQPVPAWEPTFAHVRLECRGPPTC